jgi:hypothetical protein
MLDSNNNSTVVPTVLKLLLVGGLGTAGYIVGKKIYDKRKRRIAAENDIVNKTILGSSSVGAANLIHTNKLNNLSLNDADRFYKDIVLKSGNKYNLPKPTYSTLKRNGLVRNKWVGGLKGALLGGLLLGGAAYLKNKKDL